MTLRNFKDIINSINARFTDFIVYWVFKNSDLSVITDEEIKKLAHEIILNVNEVALYNAIILKRDRLKKGNPL